MGGTQTQFDPTAPYAPASASAGSFDPTASYSPATAKPNTLGDMADVALQGLKGIAQISAPGIAASLINKTAPALAAKLQQVPYIGPMMRQAAPLNQIPGMATAAMASPLAEGMATGDLVTCRGQFVTGTRAPSAAEARVIIGSDGTAEAVPFPKANKPIARSSNDCSATGH